MAGASIATPFMAFGALSATAAKDPRHPVQLAATAGGSTYAHPGMVHTLSDIERVSTQVASSAQPWLGGWNRILANGRSSSGWQPRPLETVAMIWWPGTRAPTAMASTTTVSSRPLSTSQKYNLGHDVPFTPYRWQSGPSSTAPHAGWATHTAPSTISRGQARPVWDQVLGHYTGRKGLSAPWVKQVAESLRPDGGGGNYGSASGGYDQLGLGTLMQYSAQTGRRIARLQSFNIPTPYARHAGSTVRIEPTTSPLNDSQFRVVPGLASQADGRISFESVAKPGHFLRHWNYKFNIVQNDGSAVFKADATFLPVAGLAHERLTSFRSHTYPDRYIRHNSYALGLTTIASDLDRADATYRMVD